MSSIQQYNSHSYPIVLDDIARYTSPIPISKEDKMKNLVSETVDKKGKCQSLVSRV